MADIKLAMGTHNAHLSVRPSELARHQFQSFLDCVRPVGIWQPEHLRWDIPFGSLGSALYQLQKRGLTISTEDREPPKVTKPPACPCTETLKKLLPVSMRLKLGPFELYARRAAR